MNSPQTQSWLAPIGRLVVNFAAIELHTYWWLGALSRSDQLPLQALEWPFKRRADRISELLEEHLANGTLKHECVSAWLRSLEIAKVRNALVHSPIVFGWLSGSEVGAPDFVGIPDVTHLGSKPRVTQRIASLADIDASVNDAAFLAARLFELLSACDAELATSAAK